MPWNPISPQQILSRLTTSESAMLVNASGGPSALQTRLADAIAAFNSAILAVGGSVGPAGTMVDSLRNDCMSYCIWNFLKDFPALKQFATDARRDAYKEAQAVIRQIANRQYGALESPAGFSPVQDWDSMPKIIMRTQPGPPPQSQWNSQGQNYPPTANPNAIPVQVPNALPLAVTGLVATATANGPITLAWISPSNATYFQIGRGLAAGGETLYATTSATQFTDALVTLNTQFFYTVQAFNSLGSGPISNEASAVAGQPVSFADQN